MARTPRIQIPLPPLQRAALERARLHFGLGNEIETATHLLTTALVGFIPREPAQCSPDGEMPSGIQMESKWNPSGIQSDSNRIPPAHYNNNILLLNNNLKEGECEGENKSGIHLESTWIPTDETEKCLALLRQINGWPFDEAKDRALLLELVDDFPQADPIETIKRLRNNALDRALKPRGARNTLRTYLRNAVKFGQTRPPETRPVTAITEPPAGGYSAAGIDFDQ